MDEKYMAFEIENQSFPNQLAALDALTGFAKEQWEMVQAFEEEGIPADAFPTEMGFIDKYEASLVAFGLNLVGFFVPEMRERAAAFALRLESAQNVAADLTPDEFNEQVAEAAAAIAHKQTAAYFGLTVEEFDAKLNDDNETFSLEGEVPSNEDLGIIGYVPEVPSE